VNVSDTAEDRTKARLSAIIASCLDHARLVRFGAGSAEFDTTDGDLRLTIRIEIISTVPSKVGK
jgi:hypothetical protein